MIFEIENIGKVPEARLEMRGITVLAGKNSTGKSTFGKALYCMFNGFYESDKGIIRVRKSDIERVIVQHSRLNPRQFSQIEVLAENILDKKDTLQEVQNLVQDAVEQRVIIPYEGDNPTEKLVTKIADWLKVSDEEIQKTILGKHIAAEFEGQTTHVNHPKEHGVISLSFKNEQFKLSAHVGKDSMGDDGCIKYTKKADITNRAFYVDTPFAIDTINQDFFNSMSYRRNPVFKYNHRYNTSKHFYSSDNGNSITEEVISKKKLKGVLEHIYSAVPGRFVKMKSGRLGFQEPGLEEPLELVNVSAGMKLFLIIRRLLENGSIKEEDVLILDEPEIHLHPAWQIKFAEMLVLLQKAFDLTILLTTHSPYFLRAIEVYTEKEGIATDRCDYYYLTKDEKGCFHIQEVTKETDKVYKELAEPFLELNNAYYEYKERTSSLR